MTASYDINGRPLVPQAERPFIPDSEIETVQETVWYNPTDKDCILDLYVGTKPRYSAAQREALRRYTPAQMREYKSGTQRWVIRKGQERGIPIEFDYAIQATICQEPDCTSPNKMYCRDVTHHAAVIGGLGPQLHNRRRQFRPIVHPSLQESQVNAQQAAEELLKARQLQEATDAAMMSAQLQYEKAKRLAEQSTAHASSEPTQAPPPAAQPQQPSKKESK